MFCHLALEYLIIPVVKPKVVKGIPHAFVDGVRSVVDDDGAVVVVFSKILPQDVLEGHLTKPASVQIQMAALDAGVLTDPVEYIEIRIFHPLVRGCGEWIREMGEDTSIRSTITITTSTGVIQRQRRREYVDVQWDIEKRWRLRLRMGIAAAAGSSSVAAAIFGGVVVMECCHLGDQCLPRGSVTLQQWFVGAFEQPFVGSGKIVGNPRRRNRKQGLKGIVYRGDDNPSSTTDCGGRRRRRHIDIYIQQMLLKGRPLADVFQDVVPRPLQSQDQDESNGDSWPILLVVILVVCFLLFLLLCCCRCRCRCRCWCCCWCCFIVLLLLLLLLLGGCCCYCC